MRLVDDRVWVARGPGSESKGRRRRRRGEGWDVVLSPRKTPSLVRDLVINIKSLI